MKVINLSLDQKVLDKDSAVAKRALSYGLALDKYLIVVAGQNFSLDLSINTRVLGLDGHNKFWTLFKIFQFLDQHLKNNEYNIITIQDVYYMAFMGINLANKYKLKVELQVHGFEKLSYFRKIIAKNNFKKADKIRVVSERLKDQIIKEFGINGEKIYVVPVAIDKNKILNNNQDVKLKQKYPNDFIFLTVSRLVPVKNIAMQIMALAKLDNKNTRLVIIGDGREKDNLLKLSKKLHIADRVNMLGWIDNIAGYYRSADCFLLSSDSEGYGMVVAEAVLSGLPIIMTDVGVAGELVEDGVNGLVVAVGDQSKFILAMDKTSSDINLRRQFSVNSQKFSNKILDQQELVNNVVEQWKKIL